jgi:hypothetical protein
MGKIGCCVYFQERQQRFGNYSQAYLNLNNFSSVLESIINDQISSNFKPRLHTSQDAAIK